MKQKRYWLRGGIIMIFLYLIYTFFTFYFSGLNSTVGYIFDSGQIPGVFLALWSGMLHVYFCLNYCPEESLGHAIALVTNMAVYFFLGTIIGLIYGKIKNRNKVSRIS